MLKNTFFVCPNCSNIKKFRIFTSSFQVIKQSPETGVRIDESNIMPSLRESDNYIECQVCLEKLEYDMAVDIGKKYVQRIKRLWKRR